MAVWSRFVTTPAYLFFRMVQAFPKAFRRPPPYPALADAQSAPTVAPQLKVHLKNLGDELRFQLF